jgi:hypothetical protein
MIYAFWDIQEVYVNNVIYIIKEEMEVSQFHHLSDVGNVKSKYFYIQIYILNKNLKYY